MKTTKHHFLTYNENFNNSIIYVKQSFHIANQVFYCKESSNLPRTTIIEKC